MAVTPKEMNNMVLMFLKEHGLNGEDAWMDSANQHRVKQLLAGKTLKDPNAPKRAKSAYLLFCSENRDKVKKELGDCSNVDVTKELGVRWNILKEDSSRAAELEKFSKLSQEDRQRYEEECDSYTPPPGLKGKGKKKDPNAPKRAKSAYIFFCDDFRQKVRKSLPETSSNTDVTKELGKRWNELRDAGKVSKYVRMADSDRERYLSEKEGVGKETVIADEVDEEVSEEVSEEKTKKSRKSKKVTEEPKQETKPAPAPKKGAKSKDSDTKSKTKKTT